MLHFTLVALHRYPVKSMAGESLNSAHLTPDGLAFDRLYAFQSPNPPPGMLRVSAAERRQLLRYRATPHSVQTPEGVALPIDSPQLLADLRARLDSPALTLTHATTPQTDCRPLSLLSVQTIHQLSDELGRPVDPQRFRANLILDAPGATGFCEDSLIGQTVRVGPTAVLRILERDPRCRFITFDPNSPESPPDTALITLLHRLHQSRAGIYAAVVIPGPIHLGDPLLPNSKAPGDPEGLAVLSP
jgi:uncharacterized protein YcbX